MDHLWTPWRYAYITDTDVTMRKGVPLELAAWTGDLGCVFCNMIAAADYAIEHGISVDEAECLAGIVLRAVAGRDPTGARKPFVGRAASGFVPMFVP